MTWVHFAVLTILGYGIFDLFIKLTSARTHSAWGSFLFNIVGSAVIFIYLLIARAQGEKVFEVKDGGYLYATLGGIVIGLTSIFFFKMFESNPNYAIAVPMVRIGIVIMASLIGIFILKEQISSAKYLLGLTLAVAGFYLLLTSGK